MRGGTNKPLADQQRQADFYFPGGKAGVRRARHVCSRMVLRDISVHRGNSVAMGGIADMGRYWR